MLAFDWSRRIPGWVALLLAVAAGSVAGATPDKTQISEWKAGDGWQVRLIASPQGEAPSHYDMRIIVTASEKIRGVECWRLEFLPKAAPRTFGSGYRVLLDKKNGTPRRVSPRTKGAEIKLAITEGLPLSSSSLPGFPLEVLPLIETPQLRSKDGGTELRLSARRETGYTWWQATLSDNGKERLLIKQKWIDGEKWWSEYERWRDGQKELSGKAVSKKQPPARAATSSQTVSPQTTAPPIPSFLQNDARLKRPVTETFERPTVPAILQRLQELTGVRMIADMGEDADKPIAPSKAYWRTPACSVMNELATVEFVDGRWEPDGDGYRLVVSPRVVRQIPFSERFASLPWPSRRLWPLIGSGVFTLAALLLWWRPRVRTKHKQQSGKGEPS